MLSGTSFAITQYFMFNIRHMYIVSFNLKLISNFKFNCLTTVYLDRLVFCLMKHLKTEPLYYSSTHTYDRKTVITLDNFFIKNRR